MVPALLCFIIVRLVNYYKLKFTVRSAGKLVTRSVPYQRQIRGKYERNRSQPFVCIASVLHLLLQPMKNMSKNKSVAFIYIFIWLYLLETVGNSLCCYWCKSCRASRVRNVKFTVKCVAFWSRLPGLFSAPRLHQHDQSTWAYDTCKLQTDSVGQTRLQGWSTLILTAVFTFL